MTHDEISAYPLAWPAGWQRTAEHLRSKSRFKTTADKARRHLIEELGRLGAGHVVLSTNIKLRQDGMPYASGPTIRDPGVAIYFNLRGKPLSMARDSYWHVHDNIHALGLAIEYLRGLERHGGSKMLERAFTGFAALPPPGRKWRAVLGFLYVDQRPSVEDVQQRFREMARTAHPDAGGSAARLQELTEAREEAIRELKS